VGVARIQLATNHEHHREPAHLDRPWVVVLTPEPAPRVASRLRPGRAGSWGHGSRSYRHRSRFRAAGADWGVARGGAALRFVDPARPADRGLVAVLAGGVGYRAGRDGWRYNQSQWLGADRVVRARGVRDAERGVRL
jgi:hypothetical protein